MASRRRRLFETETQEPERPPCGTCGEPAASEILLEVRPLVLDRESGVHAPSFWTTSYRNKTVSISMMLCTSCVTKNVSVSTDVVARVTKVKAVSP